MPGPGPHLMYAMGSGLCMTTLSNGRFTPHHTLTYTINAFFGPDMGSFSRWIVSNMSVLGSSSSLPPDFIHDPFLYVAILGIPLCFFYSWLSALLIRRGLLGSLSISGSSLFILGFLIGCCSIYITKEAFKVQVPLSRRQCFLLISAGSLTHFFLDHLFEENGHSRMYTWILSTGWWEEDPPINPDAVFVVAVLCVSLIGGFIYFNRSVSAKSIGLQSYRSAKLMLAVAFLYCSWCARQIYWSNPRKAAVGEEADLGVLVFLATYFFLPHGLCMMSMHPKGVDTDEIPL